MYRPTGVIIPTRIYQVELTAEVVPLAKRRRLSQHLQILPHRYRLTGVIKPVSQHL